MKQHVFTYNRLYIIKTLYLREQFITYGALKCILVDIAHEADI